MCLLSVLAFTAEMIRSDGLGFCSFGALTSVQISDHLERSSNNKEINNFSEQHFSYTASQCHTNVTDSMRFQRTKQTEKTT